MSPSTVTDGLVHRRVPRVLEQPLFSTSPPWTPALCKRLVTTPTTVDPQEGLYPPPTTRLGDSFLLYRTLTFFPLLLTKVGTTGGLPSKVDVPTVSANDVAPVSPVSLSFRPQDPRVERRLQEHDTLGPTDSENGTRNRKQVTLLESERERRRPKGPGASGGPDRGDGSTSGSGPGSRSRRVELLRGCGPCFRVTSPGATAPSPAPRRRKVGWANTSRP